MLKTLILLVTCCCFLISATETDIGNSHQTFFDDYDTYLPSDQLDLPVNEGQAVLQRVELNLNNFFTTLNFPSFLTGGNYFSFSNYNRYPISRRKIFLYNSSLLI